MNKNDILKEYQEGKRDFTSLNLDGLSFKGENLSGANFSQCSLKNTNFSYANLSDCQFKQVTTGIQFNHIIIILLIFTLFFIIIGIAIFILTISNLYIFSDVNSTSIIFGLFFLILSFISIFFLPFHLFKTTIVKLFIIPFFLGLIGIITGFLLGMSHLPFALTLSLINGFTNLSTGCVIVLMFISLGSVFVVFNMIITGFYGILSIFIAFLMANFFNFAYTQTISYGIVLLLISSLFTIIIFTKKNQYSHFFKLTKFTIYCSGTKFCYANLINTDFNNSYLKYIDLRHSNYKSAKNMNLNDKLILN
ncbi:pentapeptide repeat-containing protein [Cyanobacterium stanieri LEGE 03274]|uniref:Pentapeptide repeat-containing protein n=1 Tax=Cyanobacterium stanieri LEGE 03274 TaxID=1828756 RepID=A0ABR9V8R0_9CHRO|nr:pentapeptide repeat-containing protein [Cyanobacterium stanieri]MBE9223536.1 pentapeptide repeat-containing protein [Cyanobacterium stanieri LEGE 03274]